MKSEFEIGDLVVPINIQYWGNRTLSNMVSLRSHNIYFVDSIGRDYVRCISFHDGFTFEADNSLEIPHIKKVSRKVIKEFESQYALYKLRK